MVSMSTVAVLLAFALGLINYIITPSFVVHRSGVVVITGASTGIGRSSAIKLATLGFTVVAGVRKDSDGKDILKSVEGSPYATFIKPIIIDVTNSATLDAAVVASQGFGPVVAVICNAGVSSGSPLPFEFTTAEEDADLFAVNYFGVAETVRRFLPALRASRGRLLLVGSVAGNFATPLGQPYSASKFAVRSLGDSLRRELLPLGVAVARIEPGFIDTPILTKSGKGASQESLRFQQLSEANQRPYRDIHAKTSAALKGATGFAGTTADTDRDIAHAITAASPQAVYHPGTVKGFPAGMFVGAMWSLSAVWQDFVTSKF